MPADVLTKWVHRAKLERSLRYITNRKPRAGPSQPTAELEPYSRPGATRTPKGTKPKPARATRTAR